MQPHHHLSMLESQNGCKQLGLLQPMACFEDWQAGELDGASDWLGTAAWPEGKLKCWSVRRAQPILTANEEGGGARRGEGKEKTTQAASSTTHVDKGKGRLGG